LRKRIIPTLKIKLTFLNNTNNFMRRITNLS
jgi:hypothetical protein